MRITVLTLFPAMIEAPLRESMLKRAIEAGVVTVDAINIRDFAEDKHKVTDDYAYGGGPGMLMKPEPLFRAVEAARRRSAGLAWVALMSPRGRLLTHKVAQELAATSHLVLVCGHYEGVDERFCVHGVDDEISIGDYVLTGGEPAALVVIDAVARLLPGALGDPASAKDESFAPGLLEYPQYTRPPDFRGLKVPEVLLGGDHQAIERWRRRQAIVRTLRLRPDLLDKAGVTPEEIADALKHAAEDAEE
ncbi:MAG: tRNA (guanosine(37)-N1)-methyltransferase TrmD [Chloroflexi bacterium]|nr:tRNA (guanosine(37)-N1)-methyltransferase TrmD [Chloroflexota bacterium]